MYICIYIHTAGLPRIYVGNGPGQFSWVLSYYLGAYHPPSQVIKLGLRHTKGKKKEIHCSIVTPAEYVLAQ